MRSKAFNRSLTVSVVLLALLGLAAPTRSEAGCVGNIYVVCNVQGGTITCSGQPCSEVLCINDETFASDLCTYLWLYGFNCQAALNGMIGAGKACCMTSAQCATDCNESGGCMGW